MAITLPQGEVPFSTGYRWIQRVPVGSPRPVATLEETRQTPADSMVYVISSEDEVDILIGAINDVTLHDDETPP
jgi:hypothetical protein